MVKNANPRPKPPHKTASRAAAHLSPRRLPLQARGKETRETILRAAGAEIERAGLASLTTKRIATAAGVSVGALYEYFPNKKAVVYALVSDWLKRGFDTLDRLHPLRGGSQDMLGYLSRQIDEMAAIYANQPGLSALLTAIASDPELLDALREHDDRSVGTTASALAHFAPGATREQVLSTARTIAIIGHELLNEAIAKSASDGGRQIENLKVCAFALASRLLLEGGAAKP